MCVSQHGTAVWTLCSYCMWPCVFCSVVSLPSVVWIEDFFFFVSCSVLCWPDIFSQQFQLDGLCVRACVGC